MWGYYANLVLDDPDIERIRVSNADTKIESIKHSASYCRVLQLVKHQMTRMLTSNDADNPPINRPDRLIQAFDRTPVNFTGPADKMLSNSSNYDDLEERSTATESDWLLAESPGGISPTSSSCSLSSNKTLRPSTIGDRQWGSPMPLTQTDIDSARPSPDLSMLGQNKDELKRTESMSFSEIDSVRTNSSLIQTTASSGQHRPLLSSQQLGRLTRQMTEASQTFNEAVRRKALRDLLHLPSLLELTSCDAWVGDKAFNHEPLIDESPAKDRNVYGIKQSIGNCLESEDDVVWNLALKFISNALTSPWWSNILEVYRILIAYIAISFKKRSSKPESNQQWVLDLSGQSMSRSLHGCQLLSKFHNRIVSKWIRFPERFAKEIISSFLQLLSIESNRDGTFSLTPLHAISLLDPSAEWFRCWMHAEYSRRLLIKELQDSSKFLGNLTVRIVDYLESQTKLLKRKKSSSVNQLQSMEAPSNHTTFQPDQLDYACVVHSLHIITHLIVCDQSLFPLSHSTGDEDQLIAISSIATGMLQFIEANYENINLGGLYKLVVNCILKLFTDKATFASIIENDYNSLHIDERHNCSVILKRLIMNALASLKIDCQKSNQSYPAILDFVMTSLTLLTRHLAGRQFLLGSSASSDCEKTLSRHLTTNAMKVLQAATITRQEADIQTPGLIKYLFKLLDCCRILNSYPIISSFADVLQFEQNMASNVAKIIDIKRNFPEIEQEIDDFLTSLSTSTRFLSLVANFNPLTTLLASKLTSTFLAQGQNLQYLPSWWVPLFRNLASPSSTMEGLRALEQSNLLSHLQSAVWSSFSQLAEPCYFAYLGDTCNPQFMQNFLLQLIDFVTSKDVIQCEESSIFGLSLLSVMCSNLDTLLILDREINLIQRLIDMQTQSVPTDSQLPIIDAIVLKRNELLTRCLVLGGPMERRLPPGELTHKNARDGYDFPIITNIQMNDTIMQAFWSPSLGSTTRLRVPDHSRRLRTRLWQFVRSTRSKDAYPCGLEAYHALVEISNEIELVDQHDADPSNLILQLFNVTKEHYKIRGTDHYDQSEGATLVSTPSHSLHSNKLGVELIIEYGRRLGLLDVNETIESQSERLDQLLARLDNLLNTIRYSSTSNQECDNQSDSRTTNFNWLAAIIFLTFYGDVKVAWNFMKDLVNDSRCLGLDSKLVSCGSLEQNWLHLLDHLFAIELPLLYNTFESIGITASRIFVNWSNQLFLNYLDWPDIMDFMLTSLALPHSFRVFYALSLFRHCQIDLRRATIHATSDQYQLAEQLSLCLQSTSIQSFHLIEQLNFIYELCEKYEHEMANFACDR